METREIKISKDTAIRMYEQGGESREIALTAYPELAIEALPKKWEDLGRVGGFKIRQDSCIDRCHSPLSVQRNTNVFKTLPQAESSIALAMYSQLLAAYEGQPFDLFLEIAKEYEPKVRPFFELFFGKFAEAAFYHGVLVKLIAETGDSETIKELLNSMPNENEFAINYEYLHVLAAPCL